MNMLDDILRPRQHCYTVDCYIGYAYDAAESPPKKSISPL